VRTLYAQRESRVSFVHYAVEIYIAFSCQTRRADASTPAGALEVAAAAKVAATSTGVSTAAKISAAAEVTATAGISTAGVTEVSAGTGVIRVGSIRGIRNVAA
jgi:hypothetical protein